MTFIIGFILGELSGIVLMCILFMNKMWYNINKKESD
jgi:hypothetical protein